LRSTAAFGARRRARVTPSAVSQAIRALEARVARPCSPATTRSVGLTEAGERFLSRASRVRELVAAARPRATWGNRPTGLLRLSMPRAIVPLIVEPVIASFSRAYPEHRARDPVTPSWWTVAGGFIRRHPPPPVLIAPDNGGRCA